MTLREDVCTEPFDRPGAVDAAVLCVHGFTSTPFEVRSLAFALAERGFAVRAPLLPGHGTSVEDLAKVKWQEWVNAVEVAFDELRARVSRVAVLGQSLGGLLSLHLAARRPEVAAVVSLAAPLWLEGIGARLARWTRPGAPLARWIKSVPKLGGSDILDRDGKERYPSYQRIPMSALGELCTFMNVVDAELPRIQAPTMVVHSRLDHTAPFACAARVAARSRAEVVRVLERSYHLISVDVERETVAADVGAFLSRHLLPL